jgi:ribosomal protein S18 acetylase RimI-like enzyme
MLVPAAFQRGAAPLALLAFDPPSGAAIGCAAFQHRDGALHAWQARVARPYRRRGIGRQLVRETLAWAAERQAREVNAGAEIMAEPEAEPFLLACGFLRKSRVFTVEAAMEPLCDYVFGLRKRLLAGGRIPPGARIAGLREAPAEPLARLYVEQVIPALHCHSGYALPMMEDPRFADSPVLLVDGQVEGMVLGEANDGQGTAVVIARAVSPKYRGGRGWAHLLLLSSALERGRRKGAHRMRFEAPEDNRDTRTLMRRVHGETTRINAWFVRHV